MMNNHHWIDVYAFDFHSVLNYDRNEMNLFRNRIYFKSKIKKKTNRILLDRRRRFLGESRSLRSRLLDRWCLWRLWFDDGRCLTLGDEWRSWSLDIWRLTISGDDSIVGVDERSIGTGEWDCERDDGRFLFNFALRAIDMMSIVGSDGNKRHRASAQRGSIS